MMHVTATTFVFGMITIVDLALARLPGARLCRPRSLPRRGPADPGRVRGGGGDRHPAVHPGRTVAYSVNVAFQLKFAALALIALNMLAFRRFVYPGIATQDRDAPLPFAAKLAGGLLARRLDQGRLLRPLGSPI